ncbi:sirohydrochlorin chelatase, partial [Ferroacidibacillus organovorans]
IVECAQAYLDAGCRKLYLSMFFLFAAGHVKHDIPSSLHPLVTRYGDASFYIGPPAGNAEGILQAAISRVQDAVREHPAHSDATVLLVVRGSSDQAAWADVLQVARALSDRLSRPVLPCAVVGVGLRFKDALCFARKAIIVLPYLLFTGNVLREIHELCIAVQREGRMLTCTSPLGGHPFVEDYFYQQATYHANFVKYAIE